MIGSTIDGKYLIRKLLGEGAMGSVYEAEHTATGRRCAVKVISALDLTRDPQVVHRFQREARAAGAIDTQHITQVLDAGVDRASGLPFLAMEFMSGEDLQHLLVRIGPLAPDLALRITAQCCLGLQKAHEAGVVHRDIKPHNLFLARRDGGEILIKLLDFGIAKVKMDRANDTGGAELTRTGSLLGTPLYMSPEQAVGGKEVDSRSDLWSLGAVLYQMLTGVTPYHHAKGLGEVIMAICTLPPRPMQDLAPWVSPDVANIVHGCLQQDPARRFQSAEEVLRAVRALLPFGWAVHEGMLGPLPEAQRAHAAPRSGAGLSQAGQSSASVALAMSPSSGSGAYPGFHPSGFRSGAYSANTSVNTHGGLAASNATRSGKREPSSARGALLAGAIGVTFLVGGMAYGLRLLVAAPASSAPPSQANLPPPANAPSVSPSTPAPLAGPQARQGGESPLDPSSDPAPRRVRVVILPADALVDVEGQRTETRGGILEISGILGSVFKVRAFKGAVETVTDVVITEAGAIPPKVELAVIPFRGPSGPGLPSTAPVPGGARTTAPKGLQRDKDEFQR